jgi:hypothetical protein
MIVTTNALTIYRYLYNYWGSNEFFSSKHSLKDIVFIYHYKFRLPIQTQYEKNAHCTTPYDIIIIDVLDYILFAFKNKYFKILYNNGRFYINELSTYKL